MRIRKPTIKHEPEHRAVAETRDYRRACLVLLAAVACFFFAFLIMPAAHLVSAHSGEDHGDQKTQQQAQPQTGKAAAIAPVRTAERNVQTPDGQFKARLRQTPPDPRAGEEAQFAADLSEQVEGGFSGSGALPIESAKVTARVTTAAGAVVANNLATHGEGTPGSYGVHYAFRDGGEYKTIFDVRTSDNRQFSADFPVSISSAPVNWAFWLGLAALPSPSVNSLTTPSLTSKISSAACAKTACLNNRSLRCKLSIVRRWRFVRASCMRRSSLRWSSFRFSL